MEQLAESDDADTEPKIHQTSKQAFYEYMERLDEDYNCTTSTKL